MHPHVETDEFDMLQEEACWSMAVELISGEAVFVPPIAGPASSSQGELYLALRTWQKQTSDEGLVLQDVFIAFPDGSRLAPDICWWSAAQRPEVKQGPMRSIPDLVVEVLSPSTRANDLGPKRELYLARVRELWLVDPVGHTLTRALPGSTPDQRLDESDTLRSEILDGFTLPLARVF
jgi:Uma2 family endonuclease